MLCKLFRGSACAAAVVVNVIIIIIDVIVMTEKCLSKLTKCFPLSKRMKLHNVFAPRMGKKTEKRL